MRGALPLVLRRYWAWLAWSSAASTLWTVVMIKWLHNQFAYGVLALWGDGNWWDFVVFKERFQQLHTPHFWDKVWYPFTYPPAMGVVLAGLYKIPHVLRWYLLVYFAMFVVWAWVVARAMARRSDVSPGMALAFTLSVVASAWPVYLLLSSGNTEGIVAILLAAGVWSVLRGRWWLGATLIGVAGALKIFPLALLALLLSRRRYKDFAFGICVAIAVTVASLAFLGPTMGEAAQRIAAGLTFVKYTYALAVTKYAPDVSHSLFSPIKFALVLLYRMLPRLPATWHAGELAWLEVAYKIYLPCVCVFGALLYGLRIRRMPMLNQLFALTICAIWLPPFSVDYTLIHLFVPLGLFFVYLVQREEVAGARQCLICFAFLFPIGTFWTLQWRFGSLVRSVTLTALLIVVVRFPWPWAELDEVPA